jgi:hypothetical protein
MLIVAGWIFKISGAISSRVVESILFELVELYPAIGLYEIISLLGVNETGNSVCVT